MLSLLDKTWKIASSLFYEVCYVYLVNLKGCKYRKMFLPYQFALTKNIQVVCQVLFRSLVFLLNQNKVSLFRIAICDKLICWLHSKILKILRKNLINFLLFLAKTEHLQAVNEEIKQHKARLNQLYEEKQKLESEALLVSEKAFQQPWSSTGVKYNLFIFSLFVFEYC